MSLRAALAMSAKDAADAAAAAAKAAENRGGTPASVSAIERIAFTLHTDLPATMRRAVSEIGRSVVPPPSKPTFACLCLRIAFAVRVLTHVCMLP